MLSFCRTARRDFTMEFFWFRQLWISLAQEESHLVHHSSVPTWIGKTDRSMPKAIIWWCKIWISCSMFSGYFLPITVWDTSLPGSAWLASNLRWTWSWFATTETNEVRKKSKVALTLPNRECTPSTWDWRLGNGYCFLILLAFWNSFLVKLAF